LNSQLQTIESALQQAEAEARRYAAMPARFDIISMELEIQTEDGRQMLCGSPLDWTCTCAFYGEWGTCSHVMAADIVFPHQKNKRESI